MAKKRGRPREIPDDLVARLAAEGVPTAKIAKALGKHPKSIAQALARAKGKKQGSLAAVRKALKAFRDKLGHFAACRSKCDPECRALRAALGEV